MRRLLTLLLVVPLMAWVLSQCRKPNGPLGRSVLRAMNQTHSALTDWGLTHIAVRKDAAILDVGCGGGRTVQKLAALAPDGTVCGIDYSAESVAASRDTNADAIAAGRVEIRLASVAALPFPDRTFDVVTAVETHYYWPDLPANAREIFRVLKPGGTFAIIAETHRRGRMIELHGIVMRLLLRAAYLTGAEHEALLTRAGFTGVATLHAPGRKWICATGRRPAAS